MIDDFDRCYRALQSKDSRFDGWFVTCVTSTGIYCRPSCPAMLPKPQNVRFLPTAAAAQEAGFRACKRCRPDASPGSPEWDVRADLVARAMRCIRDGVVDREGVAGLANRLGYGVRQLQRQLKAEVGAGPLALARAQRAQTARVLIETTALDFSSVAWGAGFQSVRQFNATVQEVFATTPSDLRVRARKRDRGTGPIAGAIDLRLPLREPFNAEGVLAHLVATMIPGVEEYAADVDAASGEHASSAGPTARHGVRTERARPSKYRRSLRLPHGHGIVELVPAVDHVRCRLRLADLRDLTAAVNRCRRLLDLDADPVAVDAHLSLDESLAPLVSKAPGRRVPRSVDPAELAIRAVLGQQVSTRSARTHAARLVLACGEPLVSPDGGLTHCFPDAAAIADCDAAALAMPASRARTVRTVASALADGSLVIDESCDRAELVDRLVALPGIGPWTAATIAMRAAGDPDAFLAGDLGIVTAARLLDLPTDAPALLAHADRWRPWRSYAVQYLWGALDHEISHLPTAQPVAQPA
ncbi:MAG TPA: Ada metal-binding domain-containing protein [Acidimicrobiia bacterium]|nr:Ada metal-binding domain-containing protein [Acidimicrobiia bacterium]